MLRIDPTSLDRVTGMVAIVDQQGATVETVHISQAPRRLSELRGQAATASGTTYREVSAFKRRNRARSTR